jgi:Ca2+-binding EF-hand superfamily protein
LEEQILRGYVSYQDWNASAGAKDLVQKCLAVNPGYRPKAAEALLHDFIGKSKPPLLIPNRLVASFQLYRQCSLLKRAAWNVLARKLPPADIASLKQLFSELDLNRSGTLTRDEFLHGFMRCGFDREELLTLFEALDINGNDEILFTEFLAASLETHVKLWNDAQLREAFDLLDEDHSGFISKRNLTKLLGNSAKLRNLLSGYKTDVNFEEFKKLFDDTNTAYHISGTMETLVETSLNSEQLDFVHDAVEELDNSNKSNGQEEKKSDDNCRR